MPLMRVWACSAILLGPLVLGGCLDKGVAKADPTGKGDGNAPTDRGDSAATKKTQGEAGDEGAAAVPNLRIWGFDDAPPGGVPRDLGPTETNGAGSPATWAVAARADAPSPPHVFGVSETKNSGQTYNLALVRGISVADVDLSVMVHADTGEQDQGGGVVFRAQGPGDYYIARWNPLEDNVRFYVVLGNVRTAIGKAELELDPGTWQSLRVVAEGPVLQLFLNDEPVLRVEDSQITDAGTIGLWTKADAGTWFDELSLAPP